MDTTLTATLAKVSDDESRLVLGWAYVARRADGSLARDTGGVTLHGDGAKSAAGTDADIVDTPEAERMLRDAFYEFIADARDGGADDMHTDFNVAKITGGVWVDPDVCEAMGLKRNALPTGALVAIRVPRTERGNQLWADIKSGKRSQLSIVAQVLREEVADAAETRE